MHLHEKDEWRAPFDTQQEQLRGMLCTHSLEAFTSSEKALYLSLQHHYMVLFFHSQYKTKFYKKRWEN